jgi:predicted phage tail protein
MANTTFNGPVRSENGFKSITKNSTTGAITVEAVYDTRPNFRQTIDDSTFNTGSAVTDTLTRAESGTLFTIDGTGDIIVNMPALSTANVGTTYEFIVTTAVGAGTTVTFVLPGSLVSNWYAAIQLMGGSAANPATDVAGDTLTLPNSTVVNSRVKLTCLSDDGTNSTWKAETLTSPIATSA